jgi:TPR repeat protein
MKPYSLFTGGLFRLATFLLAGVSVSSAAIAQSNPAVTINPSQLGTSFDCSRTGQNIPSLVCNDLELRVADLQQMQVYYALRHAAPNRQQELRTQFLSRVQGLVSNCSAENVRASGTQKQCVTRGLSDMRNFWFGQLQQTGNAAAIEEAQLNVNQLVSVQTSLKNQGLLPANSVADGVYGNMTRDAVTKLQTDRGLSATGFVNAATVQQLLGITSAGNAPQNVVSSQQAGQRTSVDQATRNDLDAADRALDAKDYETALRILRPLAERGVARAQGGMARAFANGWGVPFDRNEATRWARLGAAQNDAASLNLIGFCYRAGCGGLSQNHAQAFSFFRRSAAQGFAPAQANLGIAYFMGQGVEKNYDEALRNFRLAVSQGNALGQFWLGWMYTQGAGVEKDFAEAARLYRLASNQGHIGATAELGILLKRSFDFEAASTRIVERDLQESERLLNIWLNAENDPQEKQKAQRHLSEVRAELSRAGNAQQARSLSASYRAREKTLLEQVLNYTTTGNENGVINGDFYEFWVSGNNNDHKCIMTRIVGGRAPVSEVWTSVMEMQRGVKDVNSVDIRTLNSNGFQFREEVIQNLGIHSFLVTGDERTKMVNWFRNPKPVLERLQRAWGLAFRECPGRRSAF